MDRLYLFNPGHEEALKARKHQAYTPPKVVRQMMYDLYELSYLLMGPNDYVLRPLSLELTDFWVYNYRGEQVPLDTLRQRPLTLEMWALDPMMRDRIESWASRHALDLSSPSISERYYELSHRSTTLDLLHHLSTFYPIPNEIYPQWFYGGEARESIQSWISKQACTEQFPLGVVLKRPFTSSGRGVTKLSTKQVLLDAERLLQQAKRGEGVSLEPCLRVEHNYALLFYLSEGKARHRYISTFDTDPRGGTTYTCNLLLAQEDQRMHLISLLPSSISWEQWIEGYCSFLSDHIAPHYSGWVGIDLFSYTDYSGRRCLHPAVEINLRCTMGVLAAKASERLRLTEGQIARFGIESPTDKARGFSAYIYISPQAPSIAHDISEKTTIFALHYSQL